MSGETTDSATSVPLPVWIIAALSGLIAALAGAEPTGTTGVDSLLVIVMASLVVVLASRGPWWSTTAAAGMGAAVALQPIGAVFGAAGFIVGSVAGARPGDGSPVVRFGPPLTAGLALNSLIRSDLEGVVGLSSLIGTCLAAMMSLLGWFAAAPALRRLVVRGALAAGAFVLLAAALAAMPAVASRSDLSTASTTGQGAVAALDSGDYELAGSLFAASSENFERVDDRLSSWWTVPSRLVPVLAQNVRAGSTLTGAAATTTATASTALAEIDPASLRVSGGAIDIGAIRAVEEPLQQVQGAFNELAAAVDDVDSPWLVGPVRRELDDVDDEFVAQGPRLDNVVDAVRLLPGLLGEDATRTYLVLFTTPAEARGLGGFAGSYTTVEISDGELDVRDVGRIEDLNRDTIGADCSACADELLARYGRYGLTTGPNGGTGNATWSNLTMSAHFPHVAEAADLLFPQATGVDIDGVIVMDPYVVQQFVEYGGPIDVPAFGREVQPDEVADFILREQYDRADDREVRLDALDALGAGALTAVLAGELPEPVIILGDLAELVAERRLLMWTDRPDEQALFDTIGLLGSLPDLDPTAGGFSVSVTNASGSKIDVFLEREVSVDIIEEDGHRLLRADVTLVNAAPADGLPAYVIGNRIGLPVGSSRLFVTFYGPSGPFTAELDGAALDLESLPEAGWIARGHFVTFEPGQERRYRLDFMLPASSDTGSTPTIWEQPLAQRTV